MRTALRRILLPHGGERMPKVQALITRIDRISVNLSGERTETQRRVSYALCLRVVLNGSFVFLLLI